MKELSESDLAAIEHEGAQRAAIWTIASKLESKKLRDRVALMRELGVQSWGDVTLSHAPLAPNPRAPAAACGHYCTTPRCEGGFVCLTCGATLR